ncbi:hypothetical protein GQ457_09G000850 [Hibiscus cannabinus]
MLLQNLHKDQPAMAEKVTIMVLKVDLQCFKCYKKVKKVLCKFPQIRDQVYDEKANTVTITVICCSPEKIRDKICSKGGGAIKSIEIKPPPAPKPKEPEKPKPPEKKPEKAKEGEKPKDGGEKKPAENSKEVQKPKEGGEKKPEKSQQEAAAPPKAMEAAPLPPVSYAIGYSYMDGYHHGYGGGGPSFYGGPPQQPFQSYETMGRPVYDSWGSGGGDGGGYYRYGYGGGRTGEYFSDENPQGCSIM